MTGRRPMSVQATAATHHHRILHELERNIVSGLWPPGHRLPFEIDLARSYNVSRMTVNKVLTRLASAGLIRRRRRLGSFVAEPKSHAAILEIHDIEDEVRALKLPYHFKHLYTVTRIVTEKDLSAFDVRRRTRVLVVNGLHQAGSAPFCFEERLISLAAVPDAERADFSTTPPGKWLLRQVPWITAEHKIHAVAADGPMSKRLEIPRHAPCLVVERRTWSNAGPVTFVRFTYPGERHAVLARFTPAAAN